MKTLSRAIVIALGVIVGAAFAVPAQASCVSPDNTILSLKSGYQFSSDVHLLLTAAESDASIVGMWKVTFEADGFPHPFDSAYVQWHSDGTEIMNSSRDPQTQSFCLGVWEKTGAFTYTLRHLAISWDGAGHPVGPAEILEQITLDKHADSYSGTFRLTQYGTDGTTVLAPTPIVGTITATRITAR